MIKAPRQGGGKAPVRGSRGSPLFWGLVLTFLAVITLVLVFHFGGKDQKPGRIPPEILSQIDQEKDKAQKDFAEFIQTPAGKLWQKYPYWDRDLCQKISEGQVSPGMSKEQAREAVGRVVEVRKLEVEKNLEEWIAEGKGKEKMVLKFENNALVSVERK